MPEDVYKGVDIIEHAYNFYKINGDKFVNSDEESRKSALVEYALPLNIDGLEKDLAKYRIVYDTWFRESSLHKSGAVKQIVDMLTEKGQTYEKDGAIWFKASDSVTIRTEFLSVQTVSLPTSYPILHITTTSSLQEASTRQ